MQFGILFITIIVTQSYLFTSTPTPNLMTSQNTNDQKANQINEIVIENCSDIQDEKLENVDFSDIAQKNQQCANLIDTDIDFDALEQKQQKILNGDQNLLKSHEKNEINLAFEMFKGDQKQGSANQSNDQQQPKQNKQIDSDQYKQEDDILKNMPKATKFRMPAPLKQNDPEDLQRFKNELVNLLCCFEAHGTLTDLIVSKYNQNVREVSQPPNIQQLLIDISENKTYKQEKLRFLRNKAKSKNSNFSSLNLSCSFSALNKNYLENFSLMTDLGDILLNYGVQDGFKAILPKQCLESHFSTLQQLLESQIPRNAFGITMGLMQMKIFCQDTYLDKILDIKQLQSLFSRACFLQSKYILDYCTLNANIQKVIIEPQVINYDFMEYDNTRLNVSREQSMQRYQSGGTVRSVNYIGFIQFLFLVSQEIVVQYKRQYLLEIPTISNLSIMSQQQDKDDGEETEENDNLLKNYDLANKNASTKRIIQLLTRDCFQSVQQCTQLNNSTKITPNPSYSKSWKVAYAFSSLIDCYVLRFAKRHGVTLKNEIMNKYIQQFPECIQVFVKEQHVLQTQFAKYSTNKLASVKQLYQLLQKTGVLSKISKNFIQEYVIRNYTCYDQAFQPCLQFDEFLNCVFVASNLAFCVHPYVQYLKTPSQRLQFALQNLFANAE